MGKPKSAHKTTHKDNLIKAVRSMGISFQISNKKDSKEKNWTSLMGNEKKKLLKDLPAKFQEILRPETAEKTKKLWEVCLTGMTLRLTKFLQPTVCCRTNC